MEMENKKEIQLRLLKLGYWWIYLFSGGVTLQGTGGDSTLRGLMISTACKILFWWSYQEEQCLLACGKNWVRDTYRFLGGGGWNLEGASRLKALGIDKMIIFIRSVRNGSSLDWDDLSLNEDVCQALVKTTVNHWVAYNVWNCLTNWRSVRSSGSTLLRVFSGYFV